MNPRPTDPGPPPEPWARRNALDTYLFVLALLVATFMFGMSAPDEPWAKTLDVVLQGATLVVTLRVSRARPKVQHVLDGLVVVAIIAALLSWAAGQPVGDGLIDLMSGLLVALGPWVIFRGVGRRTLHVDIETVAAALCIYLMIGLFYAYVYAGMGAIDPPFFSQVEDATRAEYLYYSFITQTTVGYGDFTAVDNFGRAVSVSEAILGQMYLVTVVALVVSNLGRPRPRRAPATDEPSPTDGGGGAGDRRDGG